MKYNSIFHRQIILLKQLKNNKMIFKKQKLGMIFKKMSLYDLYKIIRKKTVKRKNNIFQI